MLGEMEEVGSRPYTVEAIRPEVGMLKQPEILANTFEHLTINYANIGGIVEETRQALIDNTYLKLEVVSRFDNRTEYEAHLERERETYKEKTDEIHNKFGSDNTKWNEEYTKLKAAEQSKKDQILAAGGDNEAKIALVLNTLRTSTIFNLEFLRNLANSFQSYSSNLVLHSFGREEKRGWS